MNRAMSSPSSAILRRCSGDNGVGRQDRGAARCRAWPARCARPALQPVRQMSSRGGNVGSVPRRRTHEPAPRHPPRRRRYCSCVRSKKLCGAPSRRSSGEGQRPVERGVELLDRLGRDARIGAAVDREDRTVNRSTRSIGLGHPLRAAGRAASRRSRLTPAKSRLLAACLNESDPPKQKPTENRARDFAALGGAQVLGRLGDVRLNLIARVCWTCGIHSKLSPRSFDGAVRRSSRSQWRRCHARRTAGSALCSTGRGRARPAARSCRRRLD